MKIACQTRCVGLLLAAAMMLGHVGLRAASAGDDALKALDLRQVKVGGEIGRRIDVTVRNNLLVLDAEKDFLAHFRGKTTHEGYIGLGKLVDAAVRLAAYTNDEKVIALKQRLVEETIKTQEPDGYIGTMAVPDRMWGLWDIHEMGYIIYALTSDYHYFGQRRSLDAARKAADYILERWTQKPADWPEKYPLGHQRRLDRRGTNAVGALSRERRPAIPRFLRPRAGPARLGDGHRHRPPRTARRSLLLLSGPLPGAARTVPPPAGRKAVAAEPGSRALSDRPGRNDHHRRRGSVRDLDRRSGRPRSLGRDVFDGLSASPLRQSAADRRQSALRRSDRADDL